MRSTVYLSSSSEDVIDAREGRRGENLAGYEDGGIETIALTKVGLLY